MSERVRRYLAGESEPSDDPYTADPRSPFNRPVRVGSEREGWRARLANVERDLTEALAFCLKVGVSPAGLQRALAEVRSMIDGDETTGAA